ncbi:hypothetical protein Lfu02_06760 [Longispora fulva]|uniref:hypothetical protein n=1 Tax=Longispora fulva TaxID=619741 RepID=UPI001A37303F|nr:hypothetical protein Lfu02_06760 [Longispora fulva]
MPVSETLSTDTANPANNGEVWTEHHHAELVAELRTGATIDQIAVDLGRSVTAVEAQLKQLTPLHLDIRRTAAAEEWLRERLADEPDYDWRSVILSRYAAEGRQYWTVADDDVLRDGWQRRTPLPRLALAVRASEMLVARRLVTLHLADDLISVVDQLGCAPGGSVEARYRIARDDRAVTLHTLVVDTPRGWHVSVHGSVEEARATLNRVDPDRRLPWRIASRTPGGGVDGPVLGPGMSAGHVPGGQRPGPDERYPVAPGTMRNYICADCAQPVHWSADHGWTHHQPGRGEQVYCPYFDTGPQKVLAVELAPAGPGDFSPSLRIIGAQNLKH